MARTEQEKDALAKARSAAERRAQNIEDVLAVVRAPKSPHRYTYPLEEIPEAKAERDAYLAKLEALLESAEQEFERLDNEQHGDEHAEGRCTCPWVAPASERGAA